MEALGSLWWLWLVLAISSGILTMIIHISKMKKVMDMSADAMTTAVNSMFIMAIGGAVTAVFWILFFIAIIVNIVKMAKG